ncbi:MAG: VIT and VWA domain-containing protein [Planctomycetota bacterium]
MRALVRTVLTLVLLASLAPFARPQGSRSTTDLERTFDAASIPRPAANVVVPQVRAARLRDDVRGIAIQRVYVTAQVVRQVATTTMDIVLVNTDDRAQEAELLVPVPDGAVVRGFDFQGVGAESSARLLPMHEARFTYDSIVAELEDPALLEFAGHRLVRTSVFPVPPKGEQRVRLVYETVLRITGDRIEWTVPKSESLVGGWVPWHVEVDFRADVPISTIYSPTHEIELTRDAPTHVVARLTDAAAREPGSIRISYLLAGAGVAASLWAHPDARIGGGRFLFLAGLPVEIDRSQREAMKREVVLVLDRSGSMNGEKFDQARAAALQVVEGLRDGEFFAVVDYSDQVSMFEPRPVARTRESVAEVRRYLDTLRPRGGTAIDDALAVALSLDHEPGTVPVVFFLTDGVPTAGERREAVIRENAQRVNVHGRRIYSFGVGHDLNFPLLDALANATRGFATYVSPGEDVEVAVSEVDARLRGPIMSDVTLRVLDEDGAEARHRVNDLVPRELPDLFEDDQVVLLGAYRGHAPLTFEVSGNFLGEQRTFTFPFDVAAAEDTRNGFVARIWASRRIGELVDLVRQAGADPAVASDATRLAEDAALREYTREILELSLQHGVLTEYTSFLALEGTDLSDLGPVVDELRDNLLVKAVRQRVGRDAQTRSTNQRARIAQVASNRFNAYRDETGRLVQSGAVRQAGDRTFFRRGELWIDSRLVGMPAPIRVDHVVRFGSKMHRELVKRLVDEGRTGVFSIRGKVIVDVDGLVVLITVPKRAPRDEDGTSAPG